MTAKDDKRDVFAVGEEFRGYVIERLLGKGGLGAVYLARHKLLETRFALKVLYPEVAATNAAYVKRFLREAKIATRIRHPNLVAVHDAGLDEEHGLYYIVMDWISGGDLRQAIAFAGRFVPDRAVEVVMQVASALEAARPFKLVHRDIKPENIMIQPDGLVKLVDLGIAKSEGIKDSLSTSAESVFGTPAYVAPEQAVDASNVDARADIYSLGVVLFEMIAGKPPYDGANAPQVLAQSLSDEPFPDIRDFNPTVNPMLAVLIRRMCVKEKERRIAGPAELLAEFKKLGYTLDSRSAAPVQYTQSAETAPTQLSVKDVLDHLPKRKSTLSFETEDTEIQRFVDDLKRKKTRKKFLWGALFAVSAIIVAALLAMAFSGGAGAAGR